MFAIHPSYIFQNKGRNKLELLSKEYEYGRYQ